MSLNTEFNNMNSPTPSSMVTSDVTNQQVMGPNALRIMKGAVGECNFDGRNYFAWKTKVKAVLRSLGLGDYVEGTTVDPEKDLLLGDLITVTFSSSMINTYRKFLGSVRRKYNNLR